MTEIYMDNAAGTRLLPEALDAMMPYLTSQYGNPSSIHAFGNAPRAAVERAREQVAAASSRLARPKATRQIARLLAEQVGLTK